jgi:5'-nucleotidase
MRPSFIARATAAPRVALVAVLLTALLTALLAACVAPSIPAPPGEPVRVRLIAFNDFHGNLEAAPGLTLPWPDPVDRGKVARLQAGGAAHLAGLVQALRAGARHSIVVSSGDLIGATPLVSALFLHESTVDIANRIGVDVAAPGNHEFDAGKDELLRVIGGGCRPDRPESPTRSCPLPEGHAGARFPHVAANVLLADGRTLFPASVVREAGGVRIGFIGAVTRTTPRIVVPSAVAGLRFTDEAEAINREAARLAAQGVRALVAVIHEGGDTGTPGQPLEWNDAGCPNPRGPIFDIARRLAPEIDLVFSAHTHQGYRCLLDGRPVMQATALGRGVSVADLVIDPKTGDIDRARTDSRNLPVLNDLSDPALRAAIVAAEPAPWAAALRAARPDGAVAARVAQYVAAAAPLAGRPVGRIAGHFDRSGRTDASAGRLVADAQWAATRAPERGGAQFALMNPGGVRTDLRCESGPPPCGVTYGQVFAMQPFGNSLVVMTLSGAELKRLLEDQQRPGRASPLFLIPSASLTYRWDTRAGHGARVRDLRVAGQPVDPGRDYRFTVNSFLAEGGDGIALLRNGRDRLGGELDIDALVALLAGAPAPDPVPRIALVE